jgi:hypothetical protein
MVMVTAVVMLFAMQVLLDAKMTLDEALQLRYVARSNFLSAIVILISLLESLLVH